MSNRLHILIALPRPIVTLLAEENGVAVAVSSWDRASGVARVPPLRETPKLDAVRAALRDRPARLTLLRHATVENLQAALRDRPHVFIVDTHGDEDGALLFEGPCGETNALPAAELGALLARREVRLAVLSACHSAAAAGALRAAGLPLVIGMAESIYEDAAAAYLAALLGALAAGDAPHAAHQAGLARLRSRFGRREGEAGLPQLFCADYAALRPLVADLAGDFEEAAPLPPTPEPPPPLARLFGREPDQVLFHRRLLLNEGRLATLSGMGGIGKTALARAVACWAWRRNLFPGGVFFASLETLTSGETVAARLAGQLGLAPGEGMTHQDALAAALGGPAATLLVADNCETAAAAAEDGLEVLTDLRRRCPRLRVLATGRRALGLAGEAVYELPPLPLPDAVALFLDRAGRREGDAGRRTVEAICRKLDCVPLHLELVASHKAATPAEILEGLDDVARARHLTAAPSTGSGQARPDLPERQRSQLLSFYYTWERLSAAGQKTWAVFAALFASGAEAAALRAVAGEAWPADAGLEEAVAWHVLRRWEAAGRSRYGMWTTVADFGRQRAAESSLDLPALRRRHAEYYLTVARRFKETPMEAWRTLEPEMDNVAAGFETAIAGLEAALGAPLDELAADSLAMNRQAKRPKPAKAGSFRALYRPLVSLARRLIARRPSGKTTDERPQSESTESLAGEYARALYSYIYWRRPPQSERWLRAGLAAWAAAGDRQRVGLFCNQLGLFYDARGDYDAALEWYDKSVTITEELGDKAGLAASYNNIGLIHKARGDYDAALEWYDKSVALEEELGDQAGLAVTYNNIAAIHYARGDYDAALAWYGKSVALREELGDKAGLATSYNNIASVHQARGDYDAALEWYDKSVTITEELGDQAGLATSYNNIGEIHRARGDYDAALAWYGKSVALKEELGDRAGLATSYNNIGLIHKARGDYDAALEWYAKSVTITEELGDKAGLATSYNNIAFIHQVRGEMTQAIALFERSLAILEAIGARAHAETVRRNLERARAGL